MKRHYVRLNDSAPNSVELVFHDRLPAMPTERIFKDSGQMIAPCVIARTGLMNYRARELGDLFKDRNPDDIIRVATFEEDLFDADSLATYRSSPLTDEHPEEDVNSENASALTKGQLEGMPEVDKDAGVLKGVLVVNDADMISAIKEGKSELSSGHRCTLVLNDTGEGDWDCKKVNIKNNHIAVVKRGRAGVDVCIADNAGDEVTLKDALEALQVKLTDTETRLAVVTDSAEALKVSLAEVNEKLTAAELSLKDAVTKEAVDELVSARVSLIAEAKALCDSEADFSKMSTIDIKREVLTSLYDKDYSEKSDSFIDMRYEVLLEDGIPEDASSQFNKVIKDMHSHVLKDAQPIPSKSAEARQKMIDRHAGK